MKTKAQLELLMLAIVFFCVAHYTGHKCAGLATIAALIFVKVE